MSLLWHERPNAAHSCRLARQHSCALGMTCLAGSASLAPSLRHHYRLLLHAQRVARERHEQHERLSMLTRGA